MANRLKITETLTFRCHIPVKGEQCPCDLTMKNTYTYTLATLERKAKEAGVDMDMEFLAAHAICPWHKNFLANFRKDLDRLDGIASLLESRDLQARRIQARRAEVETHNARLRERVIAHQPGLGAALINAGVVSFSL